jgi:translation initiation factor 5
MASALPSHQRITILLNAVVDPATFFKTGAVKTYKAALAKVLSGNVIIMRRMIAAAEALCADSPKTFPVLLKVLYDEDVLEEEAVLLWAGNEGEADEYTAVTDAAKLKELFTVAKPLVDWFEEEEESEEDEE